jgi:hypothetical protein
VGDAEQADAERQYGGDEPAPAAIGMNTAQEAVKAVQQERGGLLQVIDGELTSLRSAGDEPARAAWACWSGSSSETSAAWTSRWCRRWLAP